MGLFPEPRTSSRRLDGARTRAREMAAFVEASRPRAPGDCPSAGTGSTRRGGLFLLCRARCGRYRRRWTRRNTARGWKLDRVGEIGRSFRLQEGLHRELEEVTIHAIE